MSNNLFDEFLEDPYMDEIGGGFKTIARAIVLPAFQGWQFNTSPKVFPYDGSKQAGLAAREQCAEYCQGKNSYPQAGILTVIYGDDVPSHPEGKFNQDWYDFVPVFHSKEKYTGQVDVQGEYPYDLVMDGVKANRSVFNQVQWCELSRPIDNIREPKRNKENSEYAHTIYVVERVFASREEAYMATGKSIEEEDSDDFADFTGPQLSDYAKEHDWTVEKLQNLSQVIHDEIAKLLKGEGTPNNEPLSRQHAIGIVCETFRLEPFDLELLETEVPF